MCEPPTKKQRNLANVTVENSKLAENRGDPCRDDCSEIYFPKSGALNSTYKLFEVPRDFSIGTGEQLRIIGEENNHAVMCTDSKTYAIKKVETSNSVFLVAPSEHKKFNIQSLHKDYYELVQTTPNIDAVQKLLSASVYVSQANDDSNAYLQKNLRTRTDLQAVVQASTLELQDVLSSLGAVEINGFIRMVDQIALKDMIQLVLDTMLEHAWPLAGISNEHITQELVDADSNMLKCALQALGGERIGDIWRLETRAVAQEVARRVFRKHMRESGGNRRIAVDDFLIEWTMGIPASLTCPPLEFLRGIAVREEAADAKIPDAKIPPAPGRMVKYPCFYFISLDEMPTNNCEKLFEHLFSLRSRYTQDEIEPYISSMFGHHGQPKDAASLLLLHAKLVDGFYYRK